MTQVNLLLLSWLLCVRVDVCGCVRVCVCVLFCKRCTGRLGMVDHVRHSVWQIQHLLHVILKQPLPYNLCADAKRALISKGCGCPS